MTKEALKKLNDAIARRNRKFNKLDAAGKRVAIAKDVLKSLNNKTIIASPGTYFSSSSIRLPKDKELGYGFKGDAEVQPALEKMKSCEACAIGAVFVCAVKVADQLKVADINAHFNDREVIIGDEGMRQYLGKFFSQRQLHSMEHVFEMWGSGGSYDVVNPKDRMKAIMLNIIENGGNFRAVECKRQLKSQAES